MRGTRPQSVDVIVPVYGAARDLALCLDSVVRETDLTRHRLLLVVDGPQGADVEAALARFPQATVLRNDERRGFVGSVNRGMSASKTDVVLLNSDTIVTARWLEKLIDAAYSHGDVGTATPLSNNATLVSVPRAFEENLIPTGFDVASFGAHVERMSMREYPRIPTAVGFCMYIRRALLDHVGLFDEKFGLGYGEENDFCLRALDRGWLHVADDATFVFHAGRRSFGAKYTHRNKLPRRYMKMIAEFMRRDPLAAVRARIVPPRQRTKIVHLVHGFPPFQHAGSELYAYWLARRQRDRYDVAVYTRAADPARAEGEAFELLDDCMRVRFVTNNFTMRDPFRRNAIRSREVERDFARFLREEKPRLLHVHHLAGHTVSLVHVARRLGIPIVMQIHDWWFLCARVNLLHRNGSRCSGPSLSKCARCADLTKVPPAPLTNRLLHLVRKRAARAALAGADALVAASNAIRDDYADLVQGIHVIPYGIDLEASPARPPAKKPIRFGYVGSIAPHKGVHVAVAAMRDVDAELHIWGNVDLDPAYVASMQHGPNVIFEGRFAEEEKARVFASMDVLVQPSIGLESFGLAPREAMASGVPVIATSGGAFDDLFADGVCGELVPPGDVAALRDVLQRVANDPGIIDAWREHLPRPKRADEHAAEIERVYESVLR